MQKFNNSHCCRKSKFQYILQKHSLQQKCFLMTKYYWSACIEMYDQNGQILTIFPGDFIPCAIKDMRVWFIVLWMSSSCPKLSWNLWHPPKFTQMLKIYTLYMLLKNTAVISTYSCLIYIAETWGALSYRYYSSIDDSTDQYQWQIVWFENHFLCNWHMWVLISQNT